MNLPFITYLLDIFSSFYVNIEIVVVRTVRRHTKYKVKNFDLSWIQTQVTRGLMGKIDWQLLGIYCRLKKVEIFV